MKRSAKTVSLLALLTLCLVPARGRSEQEGARYYYCKQTGSKRGEPPTYFYSNVFQTAAGVSSMGAENRFYAYVQQRYGGEFSVQAGATFCFGNSKQEAAANDRDQGLSRDRIQHLQLVFIDGFSY